VKRACHALSIDEARDAFTPLLWNEDPRIEQVWFAGVHSNVGGGYPKQGMSLVALEWMVERAGEAGLRLVGIDREIYREHASVQDQLYNSRAGVGVFYRWLPRDMKALCAEAGVKPKIHLTVLERIAHGAADYSPGTLAPDATVVLTERPKDGPAGEIDESYQALRDRADRLERVLHGAFAGSGPLLDRVRGTVRLGVVAYYLYLIGCVGTVLAAAVPDGASRFNPLVIAKNVLILIGNVMTLQFAPLFEAFKRLVSEPIFVVPIVVSLLVAGLLSRLADARMSRVFSEFWHKHSPELREQLKLAHRAAGGK
jgi:hypothetical protein